MNVEDQLRTAGRAVADQLRDLPQLTLPPAGGPARRHRGRAPQRRLRWRAWVVPAAAAVAVAAVAATLVAVRDIPGAVRKPAGQPAASGAVPATPGPAVRTGVLPEYFVALSGPALSGRAAPSAPVGLMVGKTRTGKPVAMVAAQPGRSFDGVTGAADGRTFVLDAVAVTAKNPMPQLTEPHSFYLLRLAPDSGVPETLAKLPIPPTPAIAKVDGMALSPGGAEFAVLYQTGRPGGGFPYSGPFVLRVYSVASGTLLHAWTGNDPDHGALAYTSDGPPVNNTTLSWTADGKRLAFVFRSSKSRDSSLYLRQLDLTRPGNDLFADSKVILKIAVSATTGKSAIWCTSLGITADGQSAVCGAQLPKGPPTGITLDALVRGAPWTGCARPADAAYPGFAEVSLATRKLTRVLYQVTPACMGSGEASILWSGPSGDSVLGVVVYTDGPSMKTHVQVVLVDHGKVTPLHWPGATAELALGAVAL